MQLIFTLDETTELRDLVDAAVLDLRSELHHTSTHAYRVQLHARERLLLRLQERLHASAPIGIPSAGQLVGV